MYQRDVQKRPRQILVARLPFRLEPRPIRAQPLPLFFPVALPDAMPCRPARVHMISISPPSVSDKRRLSGTLAGGFGIAIQEV